MKVHQFISKFLHASSDIKHIRVCEGLSLGEELHLGEIVDPKAADNHHRDLLDKTLNSFRIVADTLTIYTK